MQKLTKKEKGILIRIIDHPYTLQALDYDYDNDDQKAFKARIGCNFKQAEKILNKLIKILDN